MKFMRRILFARCLCKKKPLNLESAVHIIWAVFLCVYATGGVRRPKHTVWSAMEDRTVNFYYFEGESSKKTLRMVRNSHGAFYQGVFSTPKEKLRERTAIRFCLIVMRRHKI